VAGSAASVAACMGALLSMDAAVSMVAAAAGLVSCTELICMDIYAFFAFGLVWTASRCG